MQSFENHSLSKLLKLAEIFAIGLNAAESRHRLQSLLSTTLQQSEEMQAQQEELKSNNEELEHQARAMEAQQQSLNAKNGELELIQRQLEIKAQDLAQSNRYKSDFLAKMSHELRTPLNGLLILSTLLIENKENTLTSQQRQFAQSINNAGHDLLSLINDILDLSKIEARKLTVHPTEFSVGDLFASKRRTFEPQTNAKKLELKTELDPDLASLKLFIDRQRLDQILRNFISNSLKFTEKGSITISAKLESGSEQITFSVADTGIGIKKDRQQKIFDAFEQADSSVSGEFGGTGLGLTISRELAALLGGEISLSSEPGKGSEFRFTVPVRMPEKSSNEPTNPPDRQRVKQANLVIEDRSVDDLDMIQNETKKILSGLGSGKKKVLVVEDDAIFRSAVVESVRSYGFEAIETGDGDVALSLLNQFTPDAILLDIKLPGISGLGILETVKQIPQLRHIPVHMISGLEFQRNALRMGALGYLTKPVTVEKIRSALGRIENQFSKKLRRVLLVEDNEVQRLAVSELISGEDIEVQSAATGKQALELLNTSGFDCVILDLTLPDVSGFDLLAELRHLSISLPPVVIYTGKDLTDQEQEYLQRHSDSIVIKGARSPERLLDEVNLFLHRVESLLPDEKKAMLSVLRSREKSFEGHTVIVVDDDIRNIFALTSALESKGLTVLTARDGEEGLTKVLAHPEINVVLMDIMMPKMDGYEAMAQIRKHPDKRIRSLPIIALTAKAMREDHERCMEAGASDFLTKPVNLENLATVLKVWLPQAKFQLQ